MIFIDWSIWNAELGGNGVLKGTFAVYTLHTVLVDAERGDLVVRRVWAADVACSCVASKYRAPVGL